MTAGLEVAIPARDRGIDLIAYADIDERVDTFVACPIQMKAASDRSFSLSSKYAKFRNLILAYVWHVDDPVETATYALTYDEALKIAETMGYSETPSWVDKGLYSVTRPGTKISGLLEEYRMTPERWFEKVLDLAPDQGFKMSDP